jgi:hypothetical protein
LYQTTNKEIKMTTTHKYESDLEGGKYLAYNVWLETKHGAEKAAEIMTTEPKEPSTNYTGWIVDQKMTHTVTHEDGSSTSLSYKDIVE